MHKFDVLSGRPLIQSPIVSLNFNDIANTMSESFKDAPFYLSRNNDSTELEYLNTQFLPESKLRDAELPWILLSKSPTDFKSHISLTVGSDQTQGRSHYFDFKILFLDGGNEIFFNDELPIRYFSHYSKEESTGGLILHLDPDRSGVIWVTNNEWLHRENTR